MQVEFTGSNSAGCNSPQKHTPPLVRKTLALFLDRSLSARDASPAHERAPNELECRRLRSLADSLAWSLLPKDSDAMLCEFAFKAGFYLTNVALAQIIARNMAPEVLAARAKKGARHMRRGETVKASDRADCKAAELMETLIPYADFRRAAEHLSEVGRLLTCRMAPLDPTWSNIWRAEPRPSLGRLLPVLPLLGALADNVGREYEALIAAVPPVRRPLRARADQLIYSLALSTAAKAIFGDAFDEAVAQFVGDVFGSDAASRDTVRKRRSRRQSQG